MINLSENKNKESNIHGRVCIFFNSHFFSKALSPEEVQNKTLCDDYDLVKNWSKKKKIRNIFDIKQIFFPLNIKNQHWSLIVAFVRVKKIVLLDSLGMFDQFYSQIVLNYLKDEWEKSQTTIKTISTTNSLKKNYEDKRHRGKYNDSKQDNLEDGLNNVQEKRQKDTPSVDQTIEKATNATKMRRKRRENENVSLRQRKTE